jgi:hypothetical protein
LEIFNYLLVEDILRVQAVHAEESGWMVRVEDDDDQKRRTILKKLTKNHIVRLKDDITTNKDLKFDGFVPTIQSFIDMDGIVNVGGRLIDERRTSIFTAFHITLNDTGPAFTRDRSSLADFCRNYAPHILKLQINRMEKFYTLEELEFYKSLKNLQELKVHLVGNSSQLESSCRELPAQTFRNLKVLEIQKCDSMSYFWLILKECANLEQLYIPAFECHQLHSNKSHEFACELLTYLESDIGRTVKLIGGDIGHYLSTLDQDFRLLSLIENRGIKLVGLDCSIFSKICPGKRNVLCNWIHTLNGIVNEMKHCVWPNLEAVIDDEGYWNWKKEDDQAVFHQQFPQLKYLKLVYNTRDSNANDFFNRMFISEERYSLLTLDMELGSQMSLLTLANVNWRTSFMSLRKVVLKSPNLDGLRITLSLLSTLPTLRSLSLSSSSSGSQNVSNDESHGGNILPGPSTTGMQHSRQGTIDEKEQLHPIAYMKGI